MSAPYPPFDLANRVGSLEGVEDPWAWYDALGRQTKEKIIELLPPEWSFSGKRVYDFGCGAGRTLRHFEAEAQVAKFYGSDIDPTSIEWLAKNLSPPFNVFVNGEWPPLPFETGSIDLVYAISVFTHLTDTWSEWMLELHRILAGDGLAVLTFIGSGTSRWISDEPWDEDTLGMNILKPGQSFDVGGPMVLHAPWWIHAHWGRAFEILELRPCGVGAEPPDGQGIVAMRKRARRITVADLEVPEPGDPRELAAALHQARQLTREVVGMREERDHLAAAWAGERASREQLTRRVGELEDRLDQIAKSPVWRLTAPIRTLSRRRSIDG